MGVRTFAVILLLLVCSCMSPSEQLAQALLQGPQESCAERESILQSIWVENAAPLVRTALTQSEKWKATYREPLKADANSGETVFQASLSEVKFNPEIVFGNQSASMGQSCEQARAHFTVHGLAIEALTAMSACIQVPNLGRRCDKTQIRLLGRASNAMISVDIHAVKNGFVLGEPSVSVRLSDLSLAEGSSPDRRTSVVFSRFQPSWEEAIARAFEDGLKGAMAGAISQLSCDIEAMSCD